MSAAETKIFGLKLGAEPKKVAALAGLGVLLAVVWVVNSNSTSPPPASAPRTTPAPTEGALPAARPAAGARREVPKRQGSRAQLRASVNDFRPSLKPDKDNPIDPTRVDPTLNLAALAKVQAVALQGVGRNVFEFAAGGAAPPPSDPSKPVVTVKPGPVKPGFRVYGPQKPPPDPPPPPPPPPTPIPLKFYGFVNSPSGGKRAFFMENEDIYIAREGELVKNRYKLVKINLGSVLMEDTREKNNQQTLRLVEDPGASNNQ
jgi:hypothetical protein